MHPRKRLFTFEDVYLYCLTSPPAGEGNYSQMVRAMCEGGADVVQLREKGMDTWDLIDLCRDLQKVCDEHGVLFIVNDRVDVALAAEVDGVHLGQRDLPIPVARQILGHRKLVGCSTHSVEQAQRAQVDGADYVGCGPVYSTPTKENYEPVGLGLVQQYKKMLALPFVAIGGIDLDNVERVVAAGADRVAVVRAVSQAPDIEIAAREMKKKVLSERQDRLKSRV